MRRTLVCAFTVLAVSALCQIAVDHSQATMSSGANPGPSAESVQQGLAMERMDLMPLAFTENQGQWDERVLFRANACGATIWFTVDGVYYQFTRTISGIETPGAPQLAVGSLDGKVPQQAVGHPDIPRDRFDHKPDSIEQLVIKASFVGANPNVEAVGEELMEYKCNYFIGNDPAEWYTNVPNYKVVLFKDIYAGIDLRYYGSSNGWIEYDLVVSPGADCSEIRIRYDGVESLSAAEDGALLVTTEWGVQRELAPVVYQEVGYLQRPSSTEYVIQSEETYGFRLGAELNPRLTVTNSPVLVYSTYLGGSYYDRGMAIASDDDDNAYITGVTGSSDFPVLDPVQTYQADEDVFVSKISGEGGLIYSTYLGGNRSDRGYALVVDCNGDAYITGFTNSSDFPTVDPIHASKGWYDVFVAKLSNFGDELIYSTYLGGYGIDVGRGLALDDSSNAYVTGYTFSSDFLTVTPYQTYQGDQDAFVSKLNGDGNALIYSTYLGGGGFDCGSDIAVDGRGYAYITGHTNSYNFPAVVPYQTHKSQLFDVFVTKLGVDGTHLIYSTYLGGSHHDLGCGIDVDSSGQAYITGYTGSTDFPTVNHFQTDQPYEDAFVAKFSTEGSGLLFSTYLGGDANDRGQDIALDRFGSYYIAGHTRSSDFPTLNPYQTDRGDRDVFVTNLSCTGNSLVYSTYLGGSNDDVAHGIAADGSGAAYVTGTTHSTDFPTLNPYQTHQGSDDVFVTKIGDFEVAADEVEAEGIVPNGFSLYQNYPNPFNPSTTIEFHLDRALDVELHILNVLGQEVRHLDLGRLGHGTHSTVWDGKDDTGHQLSSGLYFYRVRAGSQTQSKKMMLLK